MQRIIVHGGKAHFDEVFALGIMLNMEFGNSDVSNFPEVHRRDPSQNELDNPDVAVIDVGGEYDPSKNNFDHHQDESLPASFRLVADNFQLVDSDPKEKTVEEVLKEGTRWYEYKDLLDRKGPQEAAHSVGVHGNTKALVSPMESWIINQFRENEADLQTVSIIALMVHDWIERALDATRRIEEFEAEGHVEHIGDLGVFVVDREPDSFVIDRLRNKESVENFDVTITKSPRQEGAWGAYRYEDADVDLHEAACSLYTPEKVSSGHNGIFAHKTGFFSVMPSKEKARELFKEAVYLSDTYSNGYPEPTPKSDDT